ncbi:MAG: F0F1 ATP synthase subunit C [Proteobacteria bacterium]|nr:F0F1 ATP synthase subunit C [Pseudomonadota bacterium]
MDANAARLLAAGIAMIGTLGAGIGLGHIFAAWLSGIARNPAATKQMNATGFIGLAVTELVLLMGFVVSMLLLFVVK